MRLLTKLWLITIIILGIDTLILTPYALAYVEHTYESNPYQAIGYEKFGIKYFYMVYPIEIAVFFVFFLGLDRLKEYIKQEKLKKVPLFIFFIGFNILMIYTIINNLLVIK